MEQQYHLENIRRLLNEGFTAAELRRLCYDDFLFRAVYDQLADNTGKAEIIDRLLEFSEQKMQMETLLDKVEVRNPRRFKKYQLYIGKDFRADTLSKVNTESVKAQILQHQRNLNILQEQSAIFAAGEKPLHLINQIAAEKTIIKDLKAHLKR